MRGFFTAAVCGGMLAGALVFAPAAQAQVAGSEHLQFLENNDVLTVQLDGDLGAPILISGSPDDWTISLAGSGHVLVAGIPITYSWTEPDDPGLFNNLTYNGDQTFTLISDAAVATGILTLNDGDSDFIGVDSAPGKQDDNFLVLEQVIDRVPEPASMAVLASGVIALGAVRRRSRANRADRLSR